MSTIDRFRYDRTVQEIGPYRHIVNLKDHILLGTLRVWSFFVRTSRWDFPARIVDYFIVIIVFSRLS